MRLVCRRRFKIGEQKNSTERLNHIRWRLQQFNQHNLTSNREFIADFG
jgi:hypothetical protein